MRKTVNKKFIKALGKRVAEVRKKNTMTQEELAYASELSLSQIARIETGVINTTVNTLYILAKAMDVSHREFFDFDV